MLNRAGFSKVYNMEGGINAWNGILAEGMPEVAMTFFALARSPREYIAIAWTLEEGTRAFYEAAYAGLENPRAKKLFRELSTAEEHHQSTLTTLWTEISGKKPDPDFLRSFLSENNTEKLMEGGVQLQGALQWIKGKEPKEILELSVSIESNAYDRYLFMMRQVDADPVKRVFETLSREEKHHLKKLTELFDEFL